MKYTVKDITLIGVVAALTVVVGYVFYIAGSFFPVPGLKFVVFAPFLGFMMFIPVRKVQKIGVMSAVNLVFGALMAPVSIVMSIAIVSAGVSAELIAFIIFRNYGTLRKMLLAVGIYPVMAVLCASAAAYYFTGNAIYRLTGGWVFILILSAVIYMLGVAGAWMSNKVVYQRIGEKIK
jgi:energy-coupling factor transport system substrate-specific component